MKRQYTRRWIMLPIGLILLGLLTVVIHNFATHNLHTVIDKTVYRSSQPTGANIIADGARLHLASIINLRGAHPKAPWYQEERRAANKAHIEHYDIALSAHILPTDAQLAHLILMIKAAPKPVLLHCMGGADRTGLASAISLVLFAHPTEVQIKRQMTWRYNVFSRHTVGYQVFSQYFRVRDQADQADQADKADKKINADHFLRWVANGPNLQPVWGWFVV